VTPGSAGCKLPRAGQNLKVGWQFTQSYFK
jgi:hypothetical protein